MLAASMRWLLLAASLLLISSTRRLGKCGTVTTPARNTAVIVTDLVSTQGRGVSCEVVCGDWGTECLETGWDTVSCEALTAKGGCRKCKEGIGKGLTAVHPDRSCQRFAQNANGCGEVHLKKIVLCPCRGLEREAVFGFKKSTHCDPKKLVFNVDHDEGCLEYLTNTTNIKRLEVIKTPMRYGRTHKLKAVYTDGTRAVIKFPQAEFPLEPFAELFGYELDRALEIGMVPPTGKALLDIGRVTLLGGGEWGRSVWRHVLRERLLFVDRTTGGITVPVSVQLWIDGVHQNMYSDLALPEGYLDWFDPRKPPEAPTIHLQNLSNMVVIDALLANTDRSPHKNTHTMGRCTHPICSNQPPAPPRYLLIDQGKSLYTRKVPATNPIVSRGTGFCLFSSRTVGNLRGLDVESIVKQVGKVAAGEIGKERLSWVKERVEAVLRHVDGCVEMYGEGRVLLPPIS